MAARVPGLVDIDSLDCPGSCWEHCLDTCMLQTTAVVSGNFSQVVRLFGGHSSRLAWGLVVAMSVLAIVCASILCMARRIELGTKDSRRRGSTADSPRSSVGSGWARRRRRDRESSHAAPGSTTAGSWRGSRTPLARDAPGRGAGGHLFVLPVGALLDAAEGGSLNIGDAYSSMTLGAVASRGEDGARKLEIFSGQEAVRQCASVESPPPGSTASPDSYVLRGADGQRLGSLALQVDGSFAVSIREQPQLIIDGNETDLNFRLSSRDGGGGLAKVSCREDIPGGPEHVAIQVMPGTDPVTIVTCTLAIFLLAGED